MKNVLVICFAILGGQIFTQPVDDFIPCHNVPQHFLSRSKPTEQELQAIENSNKRSDSIDIINYSIDIDVTNYAGKSIVANTTVKFKTKIDQIKWITLDLKKLQIDSIVFHGAPIVFDYTNDIITAYFGQSLPLGQEDELTVYYRGVPSRDPVWGGFYFDADYIYNLGIGLSTTPPNFGKVWFPCFDNFVERSTFDYYVTSTSDKKAYCVGTFVSEEMIGSSKVKRHYSMKTPITTYLSNIAAANYTVYNDMHQGLNANIPIQLVSKPADINLMKTQFAKIPTAIDAYEYWYGPYRFERVGFTATTVGAMEHPTNVAYPVSSIQSGTLIQNEKLWAHEYGHHWWGDVTTLDDAKDMWIKEGTAEYSSHLFIERAYGKSEFIDLVKNNLSYILFNAHKNDGAYLPLSPMPYDQTYGTHTYRKGAAMMHNMRGYLGDNGFRKICTMVFDSLNGKSMNAFEFRDFLNKYSGKDMTSYFDDYIFNPGYCTFYIDSFKVFDMNGQHYAYIQIKQKSYHAGHLYSNVPLTISMYDHNLVRTIVKQNVSGETYGFNLLLPNDYSPVVILVNEDQDLNFASLQSHTIINKTGTPSLPYTAMTCNVTNVTDSSFVNIVHHLVAPDVQSKMSNIDKISTHHFWQVHMIQFGNLQITGTITYDGSDSTTLDNDILYKTEDSLLLVYRKDWTEPWREYTDYNELNLNPTDRKGFVRFTKLIPGDYALAHGYHVISGTANVDKTRFKVFPNPVNNILSIQGEGLKYLNKLEVLDLSGKTILSAPASDKIDLANLNPGYYGLIGFNAKGEIILQNSFVKI
jgi:aminopeptidase N